MTSRSIRHLPALAALATAAALLGGCDSGSGEAAVTTGKISPAEIHLAVLLVVAVGVWATDTWHGIPAAWVGMLVAVWCLFPGSGLTGKKPFSALQFEPILYVAGVVLSRSIFLSGYYWTRWIDPGALLLSAASCAGSE